MRPPEADAVRRFRERLEEEYARRFPRSREALERSGSSLLDHTSHAIRWNEPFMPIVRRARGAVIEDLDGHPIVDYWQGHMANLLGHNPPPIRESLVEALEAGRGLQSGMIHEVEGEVAELICRSTGAETVRLTTSGSLGTFYAILLARAFTGRQRLLKVAGGWHGSQPFVLKGVSARGVSFDHLESEGLSAGTRAEILLARFNDVEDLRGIFERKGGELACFVVEPILGAGGGMVATTEYLREARRLTERHGALLLCDEVVTAFRFRAGDLCTLYDVRPDLMILGKVLGGGMPVAAVAGRREILDLCSRERGRVRFEGGTYSAHELSLIAAREMLRLVTRRERELYPRLAALGERMRAGLERLADRAGFPLLVLGGSKEILPGSSLVFAHPVRAAGATVRSPEDLARHRHPRIDDGLLRSVLMLEGVSARAGLGAISTAHTEEHLARTLEGYGAALERLRAAGLS